MSSCLFGQHVAGRAFPLHSLAAFPECFYPLITNFITCWEICVLALRLSFVFTDTYKSRMSHLASEYTGDGAAYADDDWDVVAPSTNGPQGLICHDTGGTEGDSHDDAAQPDEENDDGWLVVDALASSTGSFVDAVVAGMITSVGSCVQAANEDIPVKIDSHSDEEEEEEDEEACEGAEDGEFTQQSRSGTGDEEWVLEHLIKRRRAKHPVARLDEDGHDYMDVHEYLCKWKWYDECTWEARQTIEDLGHVGLLDDFDYNHRSDTQTFKQLKPASAEATRQRAPKHHHGVQPGLVEQLIQTAVILDALVRICSRAKLHLMRYAPILPFAPCEETFLSRWANNSKWYHPRIAFGTMRLASVEYSGGPLNVSTHRFRQALPACRSTAQLSTNLTNGKASLFAADGYFLVYLILDSRRVVSSVGAPHAVNELPQQMDGAAPHLPRVAPHECCLPLWVVRCRGLFEYEKLNPRQMALCDPPERMNLSDLIGNGTTDTNELSDYTGDKEEMQQRQGVVKMRSSAGEVYYKAKRTKKQTKPKGAFRQSDLRLAKMA